MLTSSLQPEVNVSGALRVAVACTGVQVSSTGLVSVQRGSQL